MTRSEQQQILFALAAIYFLSQMNREPTFAENFQEGVRRTRGRLNRVVDTLERGGAATADLFDPDHQSDLPGKQLTKTAVLKIATQAGFPNPKLAAAIAFAESGGVPNAISRSDREFSVGLWQINTLVHPYSWWDMQDPRKNAAAAFQISKRGTDWRPWTTFTNGAYELFMTGIYR